ncbi:MAG: polysaccharide deacetylase family protein [candidate division KSB1 bacterium]|nr:polysaccharide deacetylase family protein [candidate division KSB1 bacterium]
MDASCVISVLAAGEVVKAEVVGPGKFVLENLPARRGKNQYAVVALSGRGTVDTLGLVEITYYPPSPSYLARSLDRGPSEERVLALTFDGGSLNNAGDEILDYLRAENVRATFFLTGEFIRRYPETVRRIVREGHQVGNHTWSHPHLTSWEQNRRHSTLPGLTCERLHDELRKTAELFRQVTGVEMSPYWRAPYGEQNDEIRGWAAELGYRHVGWTLGRDVNHSMDTMDWVADPRSPAYLTADQIAERILRMAREEPCGACGAIVLMHMGSERNGDFPHRKLPEIIRGLKDLGYRLVTIGEMFP